MHKQLGDSREYTNGGRISNRSQNTLELVEARAVEHLAQSHRLTRSNVHGRHVAANVRVTNDAVDVGDRHVAAKRRFKGLFRVGKLNYAQTKTNQKIGKSQKRIYLGTKHNLPWFLLSHK